MESIIADLRSLAQQCFWAARSFKDDPLATFTRNYFGAVARVKGSWNGRLQGRSSDIYIENFELPNPQGYGNWRHHTYGEVRQKIEEFAGTVSMKPLGDACEEAVGTFRRVKGTALPMLDAIMAVSAEPPIKSQKQKIEMLREKIPQREFEDAKAATELPIDPIERFEGFVAPSWFVIECWMESMLSCGTQVNKLGEELEYCVQYLQRKSEMTNPKAANGTKVFIGHGGSSTWRDLKDFLSEQLKLTVDEFNREPAAGLTTVERLEAMLNDACFAFLVFTAEDKLDDGTYHARPNVIHEAGLFQGRLGFKKAIVLLEDGCDDFSNIGGLTQIRFPKGNVMAKSEEIRRTLVREGVFKE